MSTFNGYIHEFPDIQVDYFRNTEATARCRPLACFLSHVHSDHLVGLDTLRSPLVLVLQLEKHPCRINYAKGILEARQRTYKDLEHLLKPLPLDTPTTIELSRGHCIQVTLLDANHCPGSVMFLFDNGYKAALYTGDTRLEPWFVNSLVRNPGLAVFVAGLRTLDTVYLDTTCLQPRDAVFPTKAEGLHELLRAVAAYPADTVFYLRAWTFGYEEVWAALAHVLRSKVHVDAYKMRLYEALAVRGGGDGDGDASSSRRCIGPQFHLDPVAPRLVGFMCANTAHDGCLQTGDEQEQQKQQKQQTVRIHSCEKETGYCAAVRDASVVWIRPVVCRLPRGHGDMAEVGAGSGGEDLNKKEAADDNTPLSRSITFPYSRHSSYQEQCDFLDKLRPRDVWPCTVREGELLSIQDLFGAYCSGDAFRYDDEVAAAAALTRHKCTPQDDRVVDDSQMTEDSLLVDDDGRPDMSSPEPAMQEPQGLSDAAAAATNNQQRPRRALPGLPYYYYHSTLRGVGNMTQVEEVEAGPGPDSQTSVLSELSELLSHERRVASHQAVVHNALDGSGDWKPIGLLSTSDNHTVPDVDLGHGVMTERRLKREKAGK